MPHYAYSLMSARGGGDGNIVDVVHVVDSGVTRVLMRFGAGRGGFWETIPRLALGFGPCGRLAKQRQFGNPQQLRVFREQWAYWTSQSGGPCRQPAPDCLVFRD